MNLYRIVEVPDPTGQLADLIEELFDNSALVVADPDYEAAVASVFTKGGAGQLGQEWPIEMYPSDIARTVTAALHIDPPEET